MELTQVVKSRITFIELNHHFEVLRPMLELVDLSRFSVQVAVRSIFYEQYEYANKNDFEWVLFPDTEVQAEWIDKINNLNTQQLVIVVTGSSQRAALARRLTGLNYALLIHNYTPTFHPFRLDFTGATFRDILRGAKYYLYYPGLKKLLRGASHLFFLHDQVHAEISPSVQERYPIVSSPALFYRVSAIDDVLEADERKRIVLPGTVKSNGRDYAGVGKAMQSLSDAQLAKVHLHLLGAASTPFARDVLKPYQKLLARGLTISSETHAISSAEYDRIFQHADLILCPYKARFRLGLHTDRFGLNSISGTMNDLIRFGRPALVSKYHPFPSALERSVVRYDGLADLTLQLSRFLAGELMFDLAVPESYRREHCCDNFNQWLVDRL